MSVSLPTSLTNNTLVESSFDLRCDFKQLVEVVAVQLLEKYSEKSIKGLERLPTLQLPEAVWQNDPNLANAPLYQITTANACLQIARSGVRYVCQSSYPGWNSFAEGVRDFLKFFLEKIQISSLNRIGVRYINFFDRNAAEVCKMSSFDSGLDFSRVVFNHTDIFQKDEFVIKTVIANNALLKGVQKGSLFDIDVYCVEKSLLKFDSVISCIDALHTLCKQTYFASLNDSFLKSLGPKYE